tara:strand:+ start:545 stop:970 length:426 start_codon:yes stop_codon:yes gene_type:complete
MMAKILPKTRHQLSVCEANFLRLKRLLTNFKDDLYSFETINPNSSSNSISIIVLERSNHTLTLQAKQICAQKTINTFNFRIQVCIDAKLAEVISFQGEKPIPYFIEKIRTQSKDEKIQQNRFLTEWLESIFISGISSDIRF